MVKEAGFQPPERRLEWQQTFQRDHYDAGRVAHLAAPTEREPPVDVDAAPDMEPAIAALLTAPIRRKLRPTRRPRRAYYDPWAIL